MDRTKGFENDGMEKFEDQMLSTQADPRREDEDSRNEMSRRAATLLYVNGQQAKDQPEYELGAQTPSRMRSAPRSRTASGNPLPIGNIPQNDEEGQTEDKFIANNTLISRRMTIAGGFLDIALFTANCEQLKSILEIKEVHLHYELVLSLLILSMILQAACGLTLFMIGCLTIKNPADKKRGEILNHITFGLIALITIVNIFISSFTVKGEVLHRCYECLLRNPGVASPQ